MIGFDFDDLSVLVDGFLRSVRDWRVRLPNCNEQAKSLGSAVRKLGTEQYRFRRARFGASEEH